MSIALVDNSRYHQFRNTLSTFVFILLLAMVKNGKVDSEDKRFCRLLSG